MSLGPGGPLLFLRGFVAWLLFTAYALPAVVLTGELPHRALATSVALARDTVGFTIAANVRALWRWVLVVMWVGVARRHRVPVRVRPATTTRSDLGDRRPPVVRLSASSASPWPPACCSR